MELVVFLAPWMIHDGQVPELALDDEWTAGVYFSTDEPLLPASGRAVLGLIPVFVGDSAILHLGPWYRIVTKLRRRRIDGQERLAMEVPGLVLGYFSRSDVPPPSTSVVAGRGTLYVEPHGSSAQFFDEPVPNWVVEAINLVTVPGPNSHPDWAHRTEVPLQHTDSWNHDRGREYVSYFVTLRLRDERP